MFLKTTLLLVLFAGLSACITLERSADSGYYSPKKESSYSATKEYYQSQKQIQIQEAKEELGLYNKVALSELDKRDVHYRLMVAELEDQLVTPEEKRQYYEQKHLFKNDRERIYFLRIPTVSGRKAWADKVSLASNEKAYSPNEMQAIESNDIVPGMTKSAVKLSWGEPDNIEVAGQKLYGNERWNYKKYISSPDGYQQETRVIIFESGRVAGWERY